MSLADRLRRRDPLRVGDADDCAEVGRVLDAYLDGELGADDADLVAAHLDDCVRCGIAEQRIGEAIAAIRRQRPDLDDAALARLEAFTRRLADERRDERD